MGNNKTRSTWCVLLVLLSLVVPADTGFAQSGGTDMAISVLDAPDPVGPGKVLSYRITVGVMADRSVSNVRLETSVPDTTTFLGIDGPRQATVTAPEPGSTGTVTVTLDEIPRGQVAVFLMSVRVGDQVPDGATISMSATVSAAGNDPNTANNTANVTTTVSTTPPPLADLSVRVDPIQEPVTNGNLMILNIEVSNNGPMAATDIEIRTFVPLGTTLVRFIATQGNVTAPDPGGTGEIFVNVDTLPPDRKIVSTMITTVAAPTGANIEALVGVMGSSADPNMQNNSDRSVSHVAPPGPASDIAIGFGEVPETAPAGTVVEYPIVVTNNGPSEIDHPTVLVVVPLTTRFMDATATQGEPLRTPPPGRPGGVGWRPGTLASGASATLTLHLIVGGRAGSNVVIGGIVTSDADDSALANNTAAVASRIQSAGDALVQWDPPDPDGGSLAPPRNISVTPSDGTTSGKMAAEAPLAKTTQPRDGGTVLCYNIYTSNSPSVETTPENLYASVSPNQTVVTGAVATSGSFFTVTATYADGESASSGEAGTGTSAGATITKLKVTSAKISGTGTGFTSSVDVLFDGIPFTDDAKVKNEKTKVVQKGTLITGQTVDEYTAGGGSFLVVFRNSDGGVTTMPYEK